MYEAINDKTVKPPGLLPKNLQAFVLVGIAFVMVLVMAFTGHRRPAMAASGGPPPLPDPLPVNADKVTDFQKGIEQTQRESAPQAEAVLLQRQRQLAAQGQWPAQPGQTTPYGTPITSTPADGTYPPGAYAAVGSESGNPQPSADAIQEDQRKREYLSLFAGNVALSFRKDGPGTQSQLPPSTNANTSQESAEGIGAVPSNGTPQTQEQALEQAATQIAHEQQLLQQMQGGASQPVATADPRSGSSPSNQDRKGDQNPNVAQPGAFNQAEGKKYVIFEGTFLEALLINRLDGSFSGPVSCLLSNNVYSHDRQHLLIPAGSKLLGEANKVDTFGQVRLAVAFHRLIMPDGYSVNLDQFKGLDQAGATALKDKVNNHYARIFGASLALGILGSATQLGTGSALTSNGTERIQQGFGVGIADAGQQILDRFLNILPTVTIREGMRVKIYLSNDLLLPEYSAHNIPSNL